MEGDKVHVVDNTQQTVRKSDKGSSQQEDKVILIQTHVSGTITVCARVANCLVSASDGDGTTPSHNYSHDTVRRGVDKLTRVKQLTQQGDFRACDSWDDRIILQVEEAHHEDHPTQQDEGEDGTGTR